MALKTSNSPYGESAIESHCVRAVRRNDLARDYRDDLKRMKMIYTKRGFSEKRIIQITLKMRLKLLLKAGEERKAWHIMRKFKTAGKRQVMKHKNLSSSAINGRLLERILTKKRERKQVYVVTYEDTTKIHNMLKELIRETLDAEGVTAHKVFPGILQQVYPKWAVSRMLENYVGKE